VDQELLRSGQRNTAGMPKSVARKKTLKRRPNRGDTRRRTELTILFKRDKGI